MPVPKWQAEFYAVEDGSSPVQEFLEDLSTTTRANITDLISLLEELGPRMAERHAEPHWAKEVPGHNGLGELNRDGVCLLFCAKSGGIFVIVNAFFKKRRRKTPEHEIEIALRRAREERCLSEWTQSLPVWYFG
jgi:phage-related protein